jgi:hypothetical protein
MMAMLRMFLAFMRKNEKPAVVSCGGVFFSAHNAQAILGSQWKSAALFVL